MFTCVVSVFLLVTIMYITFLQRAVHVCCSYLLYFDHNAFILVLYSMLPLQHVRLQYRE